MRNWRRFPGLNRAICPPTCERNRLFFTVSQVNEPAAMQQNYRPLPPPAQVSLLEGGIDGWKAAGLPVTEDKSQPLPLMRQVQIAAGGLTLLGVILGYTVHGGFFLISGFVGAGLMLAGMTGFCGMARLLEKMPWNTRTH